MSIKNLHISRVAIVIVLGALPLGVVAGVATTSLVGATSAQTSTLSVGSFPTNANGQTYGSSSGVTYGSQPDLILAVATNGRTGYISRDAMEAVDGSSVSSLSQAAAYMSQDASHTIPVYEKDGTTVIGTFVIPAP